jgi:hypothetical protein
MSAIRRPVRKYLREEYGVTEIDEVQNKHGKLTFAYGGRRHSLTVSVSPGRDNQGEIFHSKKHIRSMLGPPPDYAAIRTKRTMEEMMPELFNNPLAALAPLAEKLTEPARDDSGLSYPGKMAKEYADVAPPATVDATPLTCVGTLALYNRNRLRFCVTEAFSRRIPAGAYVTRRVADDTWHLTPNAARKTPRLQEEYRGMLSVDWTDNNIGLPGFGKTPATYTWVDDHVVARVDLAALRPLQATSKRRGVGVTPPRVVTPPPAADAPHAAPERCTFPTPDEMRACLAEIRRIEATTERRLVKVAATDAAPAHWAWKADLIE